MVMRVPDKLAGLSIPEYHRQMGHTAGAGLSSRADDSFARIGAAADDGKWKAVGRFAGAVGDAAKIGLNAYDDYQAAKATEAYNAFQKAMDEKMYGENGVFTRQGEAAFSSAEDLENAMRETVDGLAERMGLTPDARVKLARNVFAFGRQALPRAQKYAFEQRLNWANGQNQAAIELNIEKFLGNADDRQARMMHLTIARENYNQFAARNGLGAEQKELGWKKILSGAYSGLADKFISAGNLNAAAKLVNEDALWMEGDQDRMRAKIKNAAERLEAKARAERAEAVFLRADGLAAELSQRMMSGELEPSQALQSILGIKDKRERAATLNAWGAYSRQAELALAEKTSAAQAGVYDAFEELGAKNDVSGMYRLVRDKEKAALSNPGDKAARAAFDRAKLLYDQTVTRGMGLSRFTDPETFNRASQDIFYGRITTPEKLKAAYPGIAAGDMRPLLRQIDKRDLDAGYARERFRQLTLSDPATAALKGRRKQAHEAQQKAILLRMYDWAKETGKGHDREAIDNFIANQLRAGVIAGTGGFFSGDREMTRAQALRDGLGEAWVRDALSEADRATAAAAFEEDPDLKERYLLRFKESGTRKDQLEYAYRAYLDDRDAARDGPPEPPRPDDLPAGAVWDRKRMAWVFRGRVRPYDWSR